MKILHLINFLSVTVSFFYYFYFSRATGCILEPTSGDPVSWIMIAPSVTPRKMNVGANNPGMRLYKFETDTGQVRYLRCCLFFKWVTPLHGVYPMHHLSQNHFTPIQFTVRDKCNFTRKIYVTTRSENFPTSSLQFSIFVT